MADRSAQIEDTAERLRALYSAVVYDVMDEMGLPHQCIDLGIAPLSPDMQVAGPAYTVAAGPDMRRRAEMPPNPKLADFGVFTHMYRGCVVVVAAAGERHIPTPLEHERIAQLEPRPAVLVRVD